MLRCPNCNGENLKTIDTRDSRGVGRLRRKVCIDCGERFTTREITEREYKQIQEEKKNADAFKAFLDEVMNNGKIPG